MVARISSLIFIFFSLFFLSQAQAQKKVMALVVTDNAQVYSQPSFDADVVAELEKGIKLPLINKRLGLAFFKVQLPDKQIGYVVDLDVEFEGKKPPPKFKLAEQDPFLESENFEEGSILNQLDQQTRYEWQKLMGLRTHYFAFKEYTMGRERRADFSTWGLVWRGPQWLDFISYADIGFAVSGEAPAYYTTQLQNHNINGFNSWIYAVFSNSNSMSKRLQMVYGFGPFVRASQWELPSRQRSYKAIDVRMGGLGSWGLAYHFPWMAWRLDFQYWIEKSQYSSVSFSWEVPIK